MTTKFRRSARQCHWLGCPRAPRRGTGIRRKRQSQPQQGRHPVDVGYLLANAIDARKRISQETLLRIGATRKTRDAAADTAAIGWIAEAVRRNCGRPNRAASADLAEVVLGCKVSVERLREAERTRRERDWRKP